VQQRGPVLDVSCARGWVFRSLATGVVVPALCTRLRCDVCRPRQAARMVRALGSVDHSRRVRLSLVGDDWQTVRGRVRRLGASLRRSTGEWEWWWVCERNPRGTGHHVHALVRSAYVPQAELQNLCRREGLGIPWIAAPARDRLGGPHHGGYELKGALGSYELKGSAAEEALALNGYRLAHWSRGWWGKPYREVLRDLNTRDVDPGPWVRERRTAVA
jgi:hypothetical protein